MCRALLTEEFLELAAQLEKSEIERKEDQKEVSETIEQTKTILSSFVESTGALERSMEGFRISAAGSPKRPDGKRSEKGVLFARYGNGQDREGP